MLEKLCAKKREKREKMNRDMYSCLMKEFQNLPPLFPLSRINLSGSGCRPYYDSNAPPTNDSLPRNQLDLLCPTLCFNNLGESPHDLGLTFLAHTLSFFFGPGLPSCVCISPYKRVRGASRDGICRLFCSVTLSPLDGCSPCVDVETTTEMPTTTIKTTIPTTTTTRTTTTRPTTTTKSTKAPTQSTTPDWAKLCNALCQIGEGGVSWKQKGTDQIRKIWHKMP